MAPLHLPFWLWLRDGIIRCWVFVPCNSENISCRTFLKYKNSRKHELALWHLVNRLVPENAKYCIKVHIKHVGIQTKQAWSIKNYRYVCNVSGPSAMISDLNMLLFHEDNYCFLIIYASCLHILLVGTRGPKVIEIGITGGGGFDVRIACVHGALMLCSGTLLKRSTLITSSFP